MDPKQINLARRYARAYVHVLGDQIGLDECPRIDRALEYLHTHRTVLYFFSWVGLGEDARERMAQALCVRLTISKHFIRLIHLLGQHKRMWLLPDVLICVRDEIYRVHAVASFKISSCPALNDQDCVLVRDFLSQLLGMQVVCSCQLNVSLIAGVRAQSVGLLWERSIARRLSKARRALYEHGQYCVGGM